MDAGDQDLLIRLTLELRLNLKRSYHMIKYMMAPDSDPVRLASLESLYYSQIKIWCHFVILI